MIKEIKYTSINRVLDDLHDESMMESVTLEQAVRYTLRFLQKNGQPKLFEDHVATVDIKDFRGLMPCNVIMVKQVKDVQSGICLRGMTDNFPEALSGDSSENCLDPMNNMRDTYIPPRRQFREEPAFKTQGRVIFTSFPEGQVEVVYKGIPVDEHEFPLLIDNEVFLDALESYIILRVLRNKFRKGDIAAQVYQDAKQEYAWNVAQLNSEFVIPSESEMESIARLWNSFLPSTTTFDRGFRDLGNREIMRRH